MCVRDCASYSSSGMPYCHELNLSRTVKLGAIYIMWVSIQTLNHLKENRQNLSYLRSFFREECAKGLWIGSESASLSLVIAEFSFSKSKGLKGTKKLWAGIGHRTKSTTNRGLVYILGCLASPFTSIASEAPWKERNALREWKWHFSLVYMIWRQGSNLIVDVLREKAPWCFFVVRA